MLSWLKGKSKEPECNHNYKVIGKYYIEHLSPALNGVDSINARAQLKCDKCGCKKIEHVFNKSIPVTDMAGAYRKVVLGDERNKVINKLNKAGYVTYEEYCMSVIGEINK